MLGAYEVLPLPHPLDKRLDIDDLDALEMLEVSQVRVTGDNGKTVGTVMNY